jgi:hypothetical protein
MAFYGQRYVEGMEKDRLEEKLAHTYGQTAVNEVKESEGYTDIDRSNRIVTD